MRRFLIVAVIVSLSFVACTYRASEPHKLVSRAEWGSEPILRETPVHEVNRITIHHSGVVFTGEKPVPEYLRNLQKWSRSEKNWVDIPYHYLMDLQGVIYEGRPANIPGDTNTDYNTNGHLLVSVIGNYEEQEFSAVQFEQLSFFLADLCQNYSLPPDSIRSHKDYTETLCPGKHLYRYLEDGSLLEAVRKNIREKKNFE